MSVDTSIYGRIQPVRLRDPMETAANALGIQAQRDALQMNALKRQALEEERAAAQADEAVWREYFGAGGGEQNLDRLNSRPRLRMAEEERINKQRKGRAEASKVESELRDSAIKAFREALPRVQTPELAAEWVRAQYEDPATRDFNSRMMPLERALSSIPTDPRQFQDWRNQMALGMDRHLTLQQQERIARMNDERARSEGAANRAVTIRGQNLVDGRAREANAAGGKPPPGYRFKPDGSLEAIPGGPADIKAGEAGAKAERKRAATEAAAQNVLGAIDDAKRLVGFSTTGVAGQVFSRVGGTSARDLQSQLETIKGNLGFDRLQEMRDNSPTGGALGSVAVQELTALQSTVASLDQAQSDEQLRRNLAKIERHYRRWLDVVRQAERQEPARPAASSGWTVLGPEE